MGERARISNFSNDIRTQPQVPLQVGEVYLGRVLFRGSEHSLIRSDQGRYILDNGNIRYEVEGSGTQKIDRLLQSRAR